MHKMTGQSSSTRGIWASGYPSIFSTHLLWGVLPLYFALTAPASAFEVVAARVLFSLIFCAIILFFIPAGWSTLLTALRNLKLLGALTTASLLIGSNWLLYVAATTSGHTLDASLGYFMNPLVSVLLGVIFLGEGLRKLQWFAVALAAAGVTVMSILYGQVPWIGLGLAATFGFYGLVKSKLGKRVSPLHSFTIESAVLGPLALCAMVFFASTGSMTLLNQGPAHFWLLAASGLVTAIPLLLFADAASKLPLSVVGMIQYVSPTIQFLTAFLVFGERLTSIEWAGYVTVWIACLLFTFDAVRSSRIQRRAYARADITALAATGSMGILSPQQVEADRKNRAAHRQYPQPKD